jgi:hypothetical protein
MPYPSIFEPSTTEKLHRRIDALSPLSTPLWGKMTVAKMLAHCSVPYKPLLSGKRPKQPSYFTRLIARVFLKRSLTGQKDYRKNMPTAKQFIISEEPEFMRARDNLKELIQRAHDLGEDHYKGLEHPLLGGLSSKEWSNMLYKHLDHHLRQFGV